MRKLIKMLRVYEPSVKFVQKDVDASISQVCLLAVSISDLTFLQIFKVITTAYSNYPSGSNFP